MKRTFLLSILLVFGLFILTESCSKEKNDAPSSKSCADFNFSNAMGKAYEDLADVLNEYANNPTKENCENFRKGYEKYINTLEGFEKCVPAINKESWKESIQQAKEDVKTMEC